MTWQECPTSWQRDEVRALASAIEVDGIWDARRVDGMDERIERASKAYKQAVFAGDTSALADAGHGLDAVDADAALARGRLVHAAFLDDRSAVADPGELRLFERAAGLYHALGDERGEGEAQFWIGCFHQVIRGDHESAGAALQRAGELARRADDRLTLSYVLRHLGIAEHAAGRLDQARELLEHSTMLRRELGFQAGVAANLVGLAYIAAGQGRSRDSRDLLSEAYILASTSGAQAIGSQIAEARQQLAE